MSEESIDYCYNFNMPMDEVNDELARSAMQVMNRLIEEAMFGVVSAVGPIGPKTFKKIHA